MVRIFGGASLAGAFSSASFVLFDQYTPPPSAARVMTAISNPCNFTAVGSLSSLPPHHEAGGDHDQRKADDARSEDGRHLAPGERETAIFRLFGPDRDQILIGAEPIHGIEEEIAISVEAENVVGDPVRTADNHETALFRGVLDRT